MSNNYEQFSTLLDLPEEAAKWLSNKINSYQDTYVCNAEYLVGRGLWLYAEDNFDSELLSDCLQHALKKFNIEGAFIIEWAYTCDKPVLGQFGGAWMSISKDDILYGDTYTSARDSRKEPST